MKLRHGIATALSEHPILSRLVLIAEMLLTLCCVIAMCLPKATLDLSVAEAQEAVALRAGVYRICAEYEADENASAGMSVSASVPGGKLLSDTINLYPGGEMTDDTIWLTGKTEDLKIVFFCNGDGVLTVDHVRILETAGLWGMRLFWILLISLLLDGFLLLWVYDRAEGVPGETKLAVYGIAAIAVFSSIPLFIDYIPVQDDILFHLSRIDGLVKGIRSGIFPVRVQPGWLGGQGYAASLFYGDTLLYIPALLSILGFPLQTAYQLFLFFVNLGTILLLYYFGKKLTGDTVVALIGSLLYSTCQYRLVNLYARGAVGEMLAMTFLPLILYGLIRILRDDTDREDYKWSFLIPALGYAGIVQSHTVSIEMVGILTVLLCIVCIRQVILPKRFVQLLLTAGTALLLSLWFLVPFADELRSGTYRITAISDRAIQSGGLYLSHLLMPFIHTGRAAAFSEQGMQDSMPLGIGLSLLLVIAAYGITLSREPDKEKKASKTEHILLGFGCFTLLLTLNIFPWDGMQAFFLGNREKAFGATVISSIQFPWRFLSIASPLFVFLGMFLLKRLKETDMARVEETKGLSYRFVAVSLIVATILTAALFYADLLENRGVIRVYDSDAMGDGVILGGEYLPEGTVPELLTHGNCYAEGALTLEGFTQDGLTVEATVSGTEGTLTVPMLFYKGYEAKTDEGEMLHVFDGENHQVAVRLPAEVMDTAGGQLSVSVTFSSPWYWRVSEILSLATLVILIGCGICAARRRKALQNTAE